jgi:hypothetical protein
MCAVRKDSNEALGSLDASSPLLNVRGSGRVMRILCFSSSRHTMLS